MCKNPIIVAFLYKNSITFEARIIGSKFSGIEVNCASNVSISFYTIIVMYLNLNSD